MAKLQGVWFHVGLIYCGASCMLLNLTNL